jgi:hypothetical protein
MAPGPDLDPALFVGDLQDANKKIKKHWKSGNFLLFLLDDGRIQIRNSG